MIEKALYYFELFMTLCGDFVTSDISIFSWVLVLIAFIMVVYAFYKTIMYMLWPGELSPNHIKRTVLND